MANQTQKDLDIRINAIVNGLEDVTKTRDTFNELATQIADLVAPSQQAQASVDAIGTSGAKASGDLENLAKQADILKTAIDSITSSKSLDEIKDQANEALKALTDLSGEGADSLAQIGDSAQDVSDETKSLQGEVDGLIRILENLANVNSMEDLAQVSQDAIEVLDNLSGSADDLSGSVDNVGQAANSASNDLQDIARTSNDASDSFKDTQRALDDFADAMLQLSQGNKSLEEVKDLSQQAVDALNTLAQEGVEGFQSVNEEVQLSEESVNGFNGTIDDLITQFQGLADADSLQDISGYADIAAQSLVVTSEAVDDLVSQVARIESQPIADVGEEAENTADSVGNASDAIQDLEGSTGDAGQSLTRLQRSSLDLAGGLRTAAEAAEQVSDDVANLDEAAQNSGVDGLNDDLSNLDQTAGQAGSSVQSVADSTDQLQDAQDGAAGSAGGLGGAMDSLRNFLGGAQEEGSLLFDSLSTITGVGPTVGGVIGSIGDAVIGLKDKFGALIAGITAFIAIASLKEAAETAARVEVLGVTMNNVGQNAGYSASQLAQFEKEVKGMGITTQAAREAITQMAASGLELGSVSEGATSQIAQLARASQDLAVRMGGSSSETLQQLIVNIQQMDTEGLRYMGIILDVTKAQETFATSLGISTGALTTAQKQQAVFNQVMQQASLSTGLYEASLDTVGKKVGSLSRYQETLAEEIGNNLLPAYGALVDNTTSYLKDLISITENTDKAGTASQNWARSMDGLSKLIMNSFKAAFEIFTEANQGLSVLGATIGDVLLIVAELFDVFDAGEDSVLSIGKVIGGFATTVAGVLALLVDGIGVVIGSFSMLGGGLMTAVGMIIEGLGQILDYLPFVDNTVQQVGTNLKNMGKEGYEAGGQMVDGIMRGEGAVGKFNQRLLEAGAALEGIKNSKSFEDLEQQIVGLLEAQRRGTMTSYELGNASKVAADKIKELGDSGQLTEKQIAQLGSKLQAVGNKELDAFNKSLELIGFTAQELRTRTDASFGEIVGGLKDLAQNANTTSDVFFEAFNRSIDGAKTINDINGMVEALNSYQDRLQKSGQMTDQEFKTIQDSASNLKAKFIEVFEEGLDTSTTTMQFAKLREDVENTGKGLVKLGVLTEKELTQKLAELDDQAEETGIRLQNLATAHGLDKMGLDFDEITTGIDGNFKKILSGLDEVLAEAKLTSDQLREVFNSAIDTADSTEELQALKAKIKETFESGKIDANTYASAMTDVKNKMVEVFNQEIIDATTKQELEDVKKKYQELANQGEISSQALQQGFQKIKDKIDGMKPSLLELTKQTSELGKASVSIAQAESEAYNKLLDVQNKRNALEKAKVELSKDDNELNRLKVDIAEKNLQIAEAEYQVALTQAQMQTQNYDVLIAQQRVLNAEKEASAALDQVAAEAKVKALTDELNSAQLVYEKTSQTLSAQQQQVIALKNQKAELDAQSIALSNNADKQEKVAEGAKKAAQSAGSLGDSIANIINSNVQRATNILQEAGFAADEVAEKMKKYNVAFSNSFMQMIFSQSVGGGIWGEQIRMQEDALQRNAAWKKQSIENEKRHQEATQATLDKYQELASNAQKMAELGYDANVSWQDFAREGLGNSASTMDKIKASARDTIKAAQDSVTSFMKSIDSIRQEYLQATGQEEEALKQRYAQRRQELALEYEMLKVQITAAQITAKNAGLSTSVLDKALSDARAGYDEAQKMLAEMEKIEAKKLEADKKAKEEAAKKEQADAAQKAKDDAVKKTTEEATLNEAVAKFNAGLQAALRADPNHDGKDDRGNPIVFTFEVNGKKIQATTTDTQEDLIDTLSELGLRTS